jgi:hypothetical protein
MATGFSMIPHASIGSDSMKQGNHSMAEELAKELVSTWAADLPWGRQKKLKEGIEALLRADARAVDLLEEIKKLLEEIHGSMIRVEAAVTGQTPRAQGPDPRFLQR